MILVDSLQDLKLSDLAIKMLQDKNIAVRYWAVHALTNAAVRKQLAQSGNSALSTKITGQLQAVADEVSPETLGLIIDFAAGLGGQQGQELLLRIADLRIKRYTDWSVRDEILDGTLLKSLYSKMTAGAANDKAAFGQRFGQLYAYAMQRYIKGQSILNDREKLQLGSVLIDVEDKYFESILGMKQGKIRKAVGENDYATLSAEYEKLFGNETLAGQLTKKLEIDYGRNPDGTKRSMPVVLPEPPARAAAK